MQHAGIIGPQLDRIIAKQLRGGFMFDQADIVKHDSPVPYYFQLSSFIEQQIKSKRLVAGQLLPSEQEICEKLGVSRTVVRQALAGLERDGFINKQNGKRSAISYPKYDGSLMQNLRGFYDDAVSKGQKPTTRILGLKVVPAEGELAGILKLNEGEPVIMLTRLRFLDDAPEVLVVTHIPEIKCPNLLREDLTDRSLYGVLAQKYGLVISQGHRTVEAIPLDRVDAKLLEVRPRSPALLLKSVGFLADGTPLEYFVAKHRGDRSKFHIDLVRDPKSAG
jgi:GntR family transcriptional regulator